MATEEVKRCNSCKLEKPLTEFNRKKAGYQPLCRPCGKKKSKERYQKNREAHIEKVILNKKASEERRIEQLRRDGVDIDDLIARYVAICAKLDGHGLLTMARKAELENRRGV